jgi:hypothetical protein
MYETDHKQNEKSTRTWVSTVTGIKGFDTDGGPIGKVIIHDPSFAQRALNLKAAKLLNMLECSILADGIAKPGFEKDGRKGKFIESITKVKDVDWVTKAGAGGHAMAIMEGAVPEAVEEEGTVITIETQPAVIYLESTAIQEILGKATLPQATKDRLAKGRYQKIEEVDAAVKEALEEVKEIRGSGRPFAQGTSSPTKPQSADTIAEIIHKYIPK